MIWYQSVYGFKKILYCYCYCIYGKYSYKKKTDPDPIRIQGFNDQKFKKNYSWKKN